MKKKESEGEIRGRVLTLAKDVDCGMCQPPMDAQVALNELANFLLPDDYYIVNPVNNEQGNTQIVYDIERLYNKRRKHI